MDKFNQSRNNIGTLSMTWSSFYIKEHQYNRKLMTMLKRST